MRLPWELAEPVPDGPSVTRLVQIANRHRLVVCAGLSETERDIVYNAQVLVGPDGYIGKQRKLPGESPRLAREAPGRQEQEVGSRKYQFGC